jgi:hypothetical protein
MILNTIWSVVCRPKQLGGGGLGIINTRILTECLLTQWIWKLYTQKNSMWVKLITAKYMRGKSKSGQGSQF